MRARSRATPGSIIFVFNHSGARGLIRGINKGREKRMREERRRRESEREGERERERERGRGRGEKKKRNIWRRPRRERSRRHPSLKVLTTDNSGTREGDKEKEGGGGKKEEARSGRERAR